MRCQSYQMHFEQHETKMKISKIIRDKDILESHLGEPIRLTKYVKIVCNDESEREGYTKKVSEQLFAFLYLENAIQDKYGSILSSLNLQKKVGNYQYPRTITEKNNVLSNHNFDTTIAQNNKNQIANKINNKMMANQRPMSL